MFRGELVQGSASDLGAWYTPYYVAAESLEDAFTVRAHEVFIDVLAELT